MNHSVLDQLKDGSVADVEHAGGLFCREHQFSANWTHNLFGVFRLVDDEPPLGLDNNFGCAFDVHLLSIELDRSNSFSPRLR